MNESAVYRYRTSAWILLWTAGAVALSFVWQGRVGLNLSDEGYLWYGVQRVMLGEVPIRDFQSYDPGRYYWAASLLRLAGHDGIMALRGAVAVFQMIGLATGLHIIARAIPPRRGGLWVAMALVCLLIWMFPRHKLFDITISISLVATLAALVERPTFGRYFTTGLVIGLAAVFGRNHGVYGLAGFLIVLLLNRLRDSEEAGLVRLLSGWGMGTAVGFSPVLAMLLVVPDFAKSFGQSIQYLFEVKATNLPLAVPWPWTVPLEGSTWATALRQWLIGGWFVLLLGFGGIGLLWVAWQFRRRLPVPPALIASVALALPYAHYAFSRPDIGHLALGVFPCLLGTWIWLGTRQSRAGDVGAVVVLAASLWTMLPSHPGWQKIASEAGWRELAVGTDRLIVEPWTSEVIDSIEKLTGLYAAGGESFMAAPFWPGAYALKCRKSPVWEIYPLQPRNLAFQDDEIRRIEAALPKLIILSDLALDGREEMRFRTTHASLEKYISTHFSRIYVAGIPSHMSVYVAR